MKFLIMSILSFIVLAHGYWTPNGISRIFGGRDAKKGEIPYIVSITYIEGGREQHICGGAILNENWVITAGHCIIASKEKFIIRAGITSLKSTGTRHKIASMIVHPEYSTTTFKNDLALIKLEEPIELNDKAQAIAIITEELEPNTPLRSSGWGLTHLTPDRRPNQLQVLDFTYYLGMETCKKKMSNVGTAGQQFGPGQYCVLAGKGEGLCLGDSGGPTVKIDSEKNSYLVGVTSYGVPCARGVPDCITDVHHYRDYISKVIGS